MQGAELAEDAKVKDKKIKGKARFLLPEANEERRDFHDNLQQADQADRGLARMKKKVRQVYSEMKSKLDDHRQRSQERKAEKAGEESIKKLKRALAAVPYDWSFAIPQVVHEWMQPVYHAQLARESFWWTDRSFKDDAKDFSSDMPRQSVLFMKAEDVPRR